MVERIKTCIIALLLLSLAGLTALNLLYGRDAGPADGSVGLGKFDKGTTAEATRPLTAGYDAYRTQLGEFLASADSKETVTRRVWETALLEGGARFVFLDAAPVWLLAEGLAFTASDIFGETRVSEMILSGRGLLIYDGEAFTLCGGPLEFDIVEPAADGPGNMYPLAVLSDRFRDEANISIVLEALGFNPNTNIRYTQADGDKVYVDEQRTLHVSPGGCVTYHDGTRYPEEQTLDEREAIRLCVGAIPVGAVFWGEGSPVFGGVNTFEDGYEVTFNYILNDGVFIGRQSEFVVKGGYLREAVIRLCPASVSVTTEELMPRRRAQALTPEGKTLCVGYAEDEDGVWHPDWYAR